MIGAKINDRPQINTTRGQTTCSGLMYRFIRAIQQHPAAMTTNPAAISLRASVPRPSRTPTMSIITMENTPEGDITSPETKAS